MKSKKMIVRCARCKHRLFDYVTGDFVIEMKCKKCCRFMVLRGKSFSNMLNEGSNKDFEI